MAIELSRQQQDAFIIANYADMSMPAIGEELGLSSDVVAGRIKRLKAAGRMDATPKGPAAAAGGQQSTRPSFTMEETKDAKVLTSVMADIKTLEDLLDYANVDTAIWEVERFKVNKWEGFARVASRKVAPGHHVRDLRKVDLWQVTAHLRRKSGQSIEAFRAALLADMQKTSKAPPRIVRPRINGEPHLLEVSIPDLHMGRLSWGKETGADYDLKIAAERYMEAVEYLLARFTGFNIDKILLPTGNDLFHTDNPENTTTAGTKQDVDTRWPKSFVRTRELLTWAIERLRQVAPVEVPIVPGNHDNTKCFFLGDSLSCQFRLYKDVVIDNSPTLRKYVRYGSNLLAYSHGNEEVHRELPHLMARERPQDWADVVKAGGSTAWRLGHLHKKKETHFNVGDTFGGTTVTVLPSLASEDEWHARKGYVKGLCAAEAHLWSRDRGYSGYFSYNAKIPA